MCAILPPPFLLPTPLCAQAVYLAVYKNFMEGIDAIDNGEGKRGLVCMLC